MKRDKYDDIFSKVIREAALYCQNCGSSENLQCCHDNSRRYQAIRLDPRNAVCLCAQCHYETTNKPKIHSNVFTRILGSENRQLTLEIANSLKKLYKHDKDDIYQHYKKELKRIQERRKNGHIGKIEIEVPEVLL